jgi:hypothetical protein
VKLLQKLPWTLFFIDINEIDAVELVYSEFKSTDAAFIAKVLRIFYLQGCKKKGETKQNFILINKREVLINGDAENNYHSI